MSELESESYLSLSLSFLLAVCRIKIVRCFCRFLCLQDVAQEIHQRRRLQPPMTCHMLQPDDWRVTHFLSHCQAQTVKRSLGQGATSEENLKRDLQTGAGWKKCFQRVEKVRENLAKELGKEAG